MLKPPRGNAYIFRFLIVIYRQIHRKSITNRLAYHSPVVRIYNHRFLLFKFLIIVPTAATIIFLASASQMSAQQTISQGRTLASPTPSAVPFMSGTPAPTGQLAATPVPPAVVPPSGFAPAPTNFAPAVSQNYLKNSTAFRQEIMRMEINVVRGGRSLPITQVPRLQKEDVIKMRLLDEAVGGIKPDQSLYDWTFLVAFINPNRRPVADGGKEAKDSTVSQEIRFRKTGWYKQYSFQVPYDSQPVFFLYPKPKYRNKILKLVSRNYDEVRKLGDKTIEIAGAYAQIGSFLNELQYVLAQSQMSRYYNSSSSSYGAVYNTVNPYGGYTPDNPLTGGNRQTKPPDLPFNYNLFVERSIERLAKSFNIALPACWGGTGTYNPYGSTYGSPGSTTYGGVSGSSYNPSPGTIYSANNQNNFGYAVSQELISRAQCVAKNIRVEDFDLSVANMLQQGGIMAATYLRDKYPQLAYWINLAAAAIDFIVKIFQKAALKVVPTIVQTSESSPTNAGSGFNGGSQINYVGQSGFSTIPPSINALSNVKASGSTSASSQNPPSPVPSVKVSLYAESQPDINQLVTAYPIVVHKWQAEPDPEMISLPPPVLAEPCLHVGVNLLKSTLVGEDPEADVFTKNFKLVMNAANGFKKEFSLKKNAGLGGWEFVLTKEELNSFPKTEMPLESYISGTRGFNEIKSPVFPLPFPAGGNYEVTSESQKILTVGGKRLITIKNSSGGCQCLQAVVFKPSFGGQFVYEANPKEPTNQLRYSLDNREVSFEIDATNFQPGAGQLILVTYGGEQTILNLNIYPLPPNVTSVKMARGDNQAIISGDRLDQLQYVKINGKRATVVGSNPQNKKDLSLQKTPNLTTGKQPNSQNQAAANNQPLSESVQEKPRISGSQSGGINLPPNQFSTAATPKPSASSSTVSTSQAAVPAAIVNSDSAPLRVLAPATNSDEPLAPNERLVIFDDTNVLLTEAVIRLELGLENNRVVPVAENFSALPSRPAFVAGTNREIKAQTSNGETRETEVDLTIARPLAMHQAVILPVETRKISVNLQNNLTDYDFKIENLTVETRLEGSRAGSEKEAAQATLEVLDWKNLRVTIQISDALREQLGGRRLQLRISDRERGNSDWYTVRQTFVRLPHIESVVCKDDLPASCEMNGTGLDYVGRISTDGGANWHPESGQSLETKAAENGRKIAQIPFYKDKTLIRIKLRDYPATDALPIANYRFQVKLKP